LWLSAGGIGETVLLGVVISTQMYWVNHNTKIVQLIENGATAVEAMCALQDDYGNHPTCIILATKQENK